MTNQCQHGQLARVCLTCEHLAEIAQLREYLDAAQRRGEELRTQVAALTAERDEAREQVEIYGAERDEARAAWGSRTQELERVEAQAAALREALLECGESCSIWDVQSIVRAALAARKGAA